MALPASASALGPPLLGRDADLDRIEALLRTATPILTVTGPGGVGKTSVVRTLLGRPAQQERTSIFVDLTPLADARHVAPLVEAQIERAARTRPLRDPLLVIDNAEHLMPDVALVLGTLHQRLNARWPGAPSSGAQSPGTQLSGTQPPGTQSSGAGPSQPGWSGAQLLVTSRVPLGLVHEQIAPLGPLALPDTPGQDDVAASPAVQLLIWQARARGARLSDDPAVQADTVRLCRSLGGLPLALRLAAAGLRVHTPGELLERLERGLSLPPSTFVDLPERHRSLAATIRWSFDLLDAPTALWLRHLGVFRGAWSLTSAADLGRHVGLTDDADTRVSLLVDASLVEVESDGESMQYRLPDTVRNFARAELHRLDEDGFARQALGRAVTDLVGRASLGRRGEGQNEGLRACERHHDDLRAVMTDLLSGGRWTAAARLVIDAFFYLGFTEQLTEGALWMTTIRPHLDGTEPATRAEFLRRWADVRFDETGEEIAHEVGADYREAVRLFTQLGRLKDARDTRVRLACHERNVGRPDRSVTLALQVWTEADADADAASATLGALEASRAALLAGQDDVALTMGAHAVRTARNAALGPLLLGTALYHHAGALVAGGGATQALALGDEVERLFTHPGRPDKAAYAHKLRGEALAALGRPDAALTALARAAEGFAGSQAFGHQIHELALCATDALLASGRTDEAALLHGACQDLRLRASYRRNPRHDALLARHAALLGADVRTAALVERGRTLDAAPLIRTASHAD